MSRIELFYLSKQDGVIDGEVTISGFVDRVGKINSEMNSLFIRQKSFTLQVTLSKSDEKLMEIYKELTKESFIEVRGKLQSPGSKKASIETYELSAKSIKVLAPCKKNTPFLLKDANKNIDESISVNFNKCLDFRCLGLRTDYMQSILRINDNIMKNFRDFLRNKGFTEIITPKLLSGGSEGGANLFEVKYFNKKAFLAQSPQLYKQMAIIGGLRRVYEIGHVYRQEESNINRYLSEFTGMDLEMEITDYKQSIIFIHKLLYSIITKVHKHSAKDLEVVRAYKSFTPIRIKYKPIILSYKKCIEVLNKSIGEEITRADEKVLGVHVAEKYNVDIFVIKDFPSAHRAFYTKRHKDEQFSKSFDFVLRGEEILSGAQRIDSYEELKRSAEEKNIDPSSIKDYLDSFEFGVPKHGGCGIGLERFAKALCGFNDIRYFSMFPRDPQRLKP